jgi:putative tricarboxylic transport membrane protein
MKRLDMPMAPLVLGLVLGPLFEKALVQTSAMGDGSLALIFDRPIVMVVLGLALLQVVAPAIFSRLLRDRRAAAKESVS